MNDSKSDKILVDRIMACDLTEEEREAFTDMHENVTSRSLTLSSKQRKWIKTVLDRHEPEYKNLVSSGRVVRGKEVPLPLVLQNLPKRPPGR